MVSFAATVTKTTKSTKRFVVPVLNFACFSASRQRKEQCCCRLSIHTTSAILGLIEKNPFFAPRQTNRHAMFNLFGKKKEVTASSSSAPPSDPQATIGRLREAVKTQEKRSVPGRFD
jgi:hypothetical protein